MVIEQPFVKEKNSNWWFLVHTFWGDSLPLYDLPVSDADQMCKAHILGRKILVHECKTDLPPVRIFMVHGQLRTY